MTVKLLLLTMLASIVLSLSGCVVYDRGGYGYGPHHDRGDNRGYDRGYDHRHDDNRDYHYR